MTLRSMKKSIKSSFLVATPKLRDPNFERTVVLIAEHTPEGAFGLVLNRRSATPVTELWQRVSGEDVATDAHAFMGGPVEPGAVFLLHTCEELGEGSEAVLPGLWLGNEQHLMASLLEKDAERREEGRAEELYRVYCGYAGWGEGQLDQELRTGSWVVQDASVGAVLATPESMWPAAMDRQGGPFRFFSLMPPNPELN